MKVPEDMQALKTHTDQLLSQYSGKKKVEVLWNTRKIVKGNVYAEFLVDGKQMMFANKDFSKHSISYYFADKLNKPEIDIYLGIGEVFSLHDDDEEAHCYGSYIIH